MGSVCEVVCGGGRGSGGSVWRKGGVTRSGGGTKVGWVVNNALERALCVD